ncbi:hypothetical protein FRB94_007269 [Tulasnella sp. JGI-2019a]|nr:hypothetical protein FRB94_007269 [Tulasnella sp. JGI-2019a]
MSQTYNANPTVFAASVHSFRQHDPDTLWLPHGESPSDDEDEDTPIDAQEVFDLLRSITDPEHPLTLEELKVVSRDQIKVDGRMVDVEFTPTTPACGMANVIGKCLTGLGLAIIAAEPDCHHFLRISHHGPSNPESTNEIQGEDIHDTRKPST